LIRKVVLLTVVALADAWELYTKKMINTMKTSKEVSIPERRLVKEKTHPLADQEMLTRAL